MRTTLVLLSGLFVTFTSVAFAEDAVAPAYSRDGFDWYSAPLQAPAKTTVAHACERLYGKHTEVEAAKEPKEGFLCSVPTPSEPRLSTRLKDEIALISPDLSDTKRENLTNTLIEKYQRLAQCPEGTKATWDGTMYFCAKSYVAKDLCVAGGAPTQLDSGQYGCVLMTCPKASMDLFVLTQGQHAGCFKCPKGVFDAKETDAFHGALKGMPSDYKEVFCKAKAEGAKK